MVRPKEEKLDFEHAMRPYHFVLSCLMLAVVLVLQAFCDDDGEQRDSALQAINTRSIGDLICGPKCVRKVLQLYGKEDEDIIRLVREIQWPEVRNGATMDRVAQSLEKRGIHTFAMQIKPSARIVWPYPVIVHLTPKPNDDIGHFVVWLPESQGSMARVWNTDEKVQQRDEREWSRERSGAVLLTSPEPIDDPNKALKWVGLPFYDYGETIFAMVIFLTGLGLTIWAFGLHQFLRKGEML